MNWDNYWWSLEATTWTCKKATPKRSSAFWITQKCQTHQKAAHARSWSRKLNWKHEQYSQQSSPVFPSTVRRKSAPPLRNKSKSLEITKVQTLKEDKAGSIQAVKDAIADSYRRNLGLAAVSLDFGKAFWQLWLHLPEDNTETNRRAQNDTEANQNSLTIHVF